jgi:hypothetical protein
LLMRRMGSHSSGPFGVDLTGLSEPDDLGGYGFSERIGGLPEFQCFARLLKSQAHGFYEVRRKGQIIDPISYRHDGSPRVNRLFFIKPAGPQRK